MEPTTENRSTILKRAVEGLFHLVGQVAERTVALVQGHDSRAVANYFVRRAEADGRRLAVMQLIKLVYIAHGFALGLTGRPLISHSVVARRYGPVILEVYESFPPRSVYVFACVKDAFGKPYDDDDKFSDDESEILDMIYKMYSHLGSIQLSVITHEEGAPWDQVNRAGKWGVIPNSIIREYYAGRIRDVAKERRRLEAQGAA